MNDENSRPKFLNVAADSSAIRAGLQRKARTVDRAHRPRAVAFPSGTTRPETAATPHRRPALTNSQTCSRGRGAVALVADRRCVSGRIPPHVVGLLVVVPLPHAAARENRGGQRGPWPPVFQVGQWAARLYPAIPRHSRICVNPDWTANLLRRDRGFRVESLGIVAYAQLSSLDPAGRCAPCRF